MPSPDDIAFAERLFRAELGIEVAGLFWIAAELAILFCMLVARFHVEHRPAQPAMSLDPRHRRQIHRWIAAFLLLTAAVLGRHLVISPLPAGVSQATNEQALAAAYATRIWVHNGVWFAFVTAWVVLETVIVYHGWRTYRSLRRLFHVEQLASASGSPSGLAVILILCGAFAAVTATGALRAVLLTTGAGAGALEAVHEEFQPLRDVMGFYLRLAGVVWITVEWVAAFYLWRGWRLLRHVAVRRGAMADA